MRQLRYAARLLVRTPGMNLTGAGTPERIFGIQASSNFLDVLGGQPGIIIGVMPAGFQSPRRSVNGSRCSS